MIIKLWHCDNAWYTHTRFVSFGFRGGTGGTGGVLFVLAPETCGELDDTVMWPFGGDSFLSTNWSSS